MQEIILADHLKKPVSHDPVDYYTKAVSRYKLLTKEEEIEMAVAIQKGDVEAENKFINANLRLVLKVASHYRRRGLAFSDLIMEGNIGLMHAVKRYDPDKGFRFATYAVWWVRQAIERALMSQTRTIRLPVHIVKRLSRCMRLGEKAAHLSHTSNASDEVMAKEANVTVDDVRFLMSHRHNTVSLEHRTNNDSDREIIDFISDVDCPEKNVATLDLKEHLSQCMSVLSDLEISVLSARFGLGKHEESSLNKIAELCGITRDQVRRVLQHALTKMKRSI